MPPLRWHLVRGNAVGLRRPASGRARFAHRFRRRTFRRTDVPGVRRGYDSNQLRARFGRVHQPLHCLWRNLGRIGAARVTRKVSSRHARDQCPRAGHGRRSAQLEPVTARTPGSSITPAFGDHCHRLYSLRGDSSCRSRHHASAGHVSPSWLHGGHLVSRAVHLVSRRDGEGGASQLSRPANRSADAGGLCGNCRLDSASCACRRDLDYSHAMTMDGLVNGALPIRRPGGC